ncbi:MAG TPA: peptidylprolyl isomerase [Kofleriaceae bacterium]|nr:peptidylprolyl isomerase [Kofleriaceae bacterium]
MTRLAPLVTLALALPAAASGPRARLDGVVAVVNDAVILRDELDARLEVMKQDVDRIEDPAERKRRLASLEGQVLDVMIADELIAQAGEAQHVTVDGSEITAEIERVKRDHHIGDAELEQALTAEGYTMASYRAEIGRNLLRLRTISQNIAAKVQVGDEEIRSEYDRMARQTSQVAAVQVAHMLFALPDHPTEQQIESARQRASDALARVQHGEPFAAVCAEVSDDTSTRNTGGQLGWFQQGETDRAWDQTIFSMAKGDTRGPVRDSAGFHVLQVTDIKQSHLEPFDTAKAKIADELERREIEKRTEAWVQELRKKAYVEITL